MMAFIFGSLGVLITLGNLLLWAHWSEKKNDWDFWLEHIRKQQPPTPAQYYYQRGLQDASRAFHTQFNRALAKDDKVKTPWRERMFGAKQAIDALVEKAGQ